MIAARRSRIGHPGIVTRRVVTRRRAPRLERLGAARREEKRYIEWSTRTRLGRANNWFWTRWVDRGWWWKSYALIIGATLIGLGIRALVR
jgi:hypothetical protein